MIGSLEGQLAEAADRNQSLKRELGEKESRIQTLSEELETLSAELQTVSTESELRQERLDKITGSLGWRILRPYGPVKHRFVLPVYNRVTSLLKPMFQKRG